MTPPSSARQTAGWLGAPALAAFVAFGAACSKPESSGAEPPPPTSIELPSASAPPETASAAAPAAPAHAGARAEEDASDAARAEAAPKPLDGGSTGAPDGSASAPSGDCGGKSLPDCPLQAWMKANANPPAMKNDLPALATTLDEMARFAPPGYTNWASISKDGAAAARSGDLAAAKASCRGCHDQYKQRYKTELRARAI